MYLADLLCKQARIAGRQLTHATFADIRRRLPLPRRLALDKRRQLLKRRELAALGRDDQDPVGKKLVFGFPPDGTVVRDVVGIVGDVRDVALGREPGAMMYVPFAQAPFWGANLVIRSTVDPSSVAATIRREVRKLDRDLPVTDVALMSDTLEASLAQPRFRTFLLGVFAIAATLLVLEDEGGHLAGIVVDAVVGDAVLENIIPDISRVLLAGRSRQGSRTAC